MSCVEKTIVVPRSRSASTASLSASALTGSSPLNGSSRISSSGSETTAAMNCTFCACPFDSDSTLQARAIGELQPLEPGVDGAVERARAAPT